MKRRMFVWAIMLGVLFMPLLAGCAQGMADGQFPPEDAAALRDLPPADAGRFRDATVEMTASDVHGTPADASSDSGSPGGGCVPEACDGLDNNCNGQIDEIFPCPLGAHGDRCVTFCGTIGYRVCAAPSCNWSTYCSPSLENCTNGIDDNCDGRVDCTDDECRGNPACVVDGGALPVATMRYEFQIDPSAGWEAAEPYRLRDEWWNPITCLNTGSTDLALAPDGWHRCDTAGPVTPFDGSFYSAAHPGWGDHGELGTVGNAPARCTPLEGAEWLITDLVRGHVLYTGLSSGLPCVAVGSQDRHELP